MGKQRQHFPFREKYCLRTGALATGEQALHLATTSSHMSSQQGNTYGNGGYGGNPGQSFMAPQRQEMSYLCAGERAVCSEICSWRCSSRTFSTWRLRRVERDPASRAHPLQAVRSSHHVQEKDNQECVPSFPSHLLFDADARCSGTVRGAVTSRAVALQFAACFLLRPRALGISRILSSHFDTRHHSPTPSLSSAIALALFAPTRRIRRVLLHTLFAQCVHLDSSHVDYHGNVIHLVPTLHRM